MEILADIPFDVDADALLATLRIPPESDRAADIRTMVEAVRPIVRPKAVYDVCYIESRGDDTVVLGGATFTSRVLRVNLDQAERVFPFVVTCGREVADHAASFDDLVVSFALDTLMVKALGAAIAFLETHVKTTYELGRTAVMNPGSLDDWPLTEQKQLFSVFGDVRELIGVELTDSCLMVPVKSVSGILFPTEVRFESCQLCPREVCPSRRAKHQPELWEKRYRREVREDAGKRAE